MLKRILRGMGANAMTQVVTLVLQFLLVPLMATQWGLERYGVWLLLFTIPSYLAQGDFGFGTAAGNDMIAKFAKHDVEGALRVFHSARLAILFCSSAVCVAALAIVYLMPDAWLHVSGDITSMETRLALGILIVYGIVCLQGSLIQAGFRSFGRYATGTSLQALTTFTEGMAAVALVLLGASFPQLALSYLLCRIVNLALQTVLMRRIAPVLTLDFSYAEGGEIRRLWRPAASVMVLPMAQATFLQGTAAAVGWASSAATVAVFISVRTLIRAAVQMTTLLNHALMPELSRASAVGEKSVAAMVVVTIVASFLILLPVAAILLVFGQDIVRLWTNNTIVPPWGFLALMSAVMVVNGFWHPLSNLLLAANHQASYSYAFLAAAAASVVLAAALVGWIGVSGAGVSLLLLDLFMAQLVVRNVFRLLLAGGSWPVLKATSGELISNSAELLGRLRRPKR